MQRIGRNVSGISGDDRRYIWIGGEMVSEACRICHGFYVHRISIYPKIKTRVVGTEWHRDSGPGVDEMFLDMPFSQVPEQIIEEAG